MQGPSSKEKSDEVQQMMAAMGDAVWAESIPWTRQIRDFRRWKDRDEYQKARLIRDLQADSVSNASLINPYIDRR